MDELWRNIRLITVLLERLSKYRNDDLNNLDDMLTLIESLKTEIDKAESEVKHYIRRYK